MHAVSIDDVLSTRYVPPYDPVSLSPDGRWATYTVADPSKVVGADAHHTMFTSTGVQILARGCTVWVVDLRSGQSRNVSGDVGSSWGASWSPDGRYLAFYSDRDGLARLWLWDAVSGRAHRVSADVVHPTYQGFEVPRWLPDGKHLIVKLLPAHMSLQDAIRLAETGDRQTHAVAAAHDSTTTVYESGNSTDSSSESRDSIDGTWTGAYQGSLAVVDVLTGATRDLVSDVATDGYWVSPSGKWLAYTVARGNIAHTQQNVFDLSVIPTAGGRSVVLSKQIAQLYGIAVAWSPDDKTLAYTNSGVDFQSAASVPRGDVFLVNIEGGRPRDLTNGSHPQFGDTFRTPLWNRDGSAIYLLGADTVWRLTIATDRLEPIASVPDRQLTDIVGPPSDGLVWTPDSERSMYVRIRDTATLRVGIARIGVRDRSSQIILEENASYGYEHFTTDASGNRVLYVSQAASHGDELSLFDVTTLKAQRLVALNTQFDDAALGRAQLVQWFDRDGHVLRGVLITPSPATHLHPPFPLIVFVYGGELRSRLLNEFGGGGGVENMQLFASHGYAVLLPDAPIVDRPMSDIANSVLPGVSRMVDLGVADPDRIGVMGESYGGYSVLALLVQSDRFRAAVCSAGPADLFSMWGQMGPSGAALGVSWAEQGQGGMNGSPWQQRDRYIENSPFFYLDRVRTPVLLIQGAADPVVPAFLSDQVFVSLRRLGRRVIYVKYAGEGHTAAVFSRGNARDYLARILDWFDSYMGPSRHATNSNDEHAVRSSPH